MSNHYVTTVIDCSSGKLILSFDIVMPIFFIQQCASIDLIPTWQLLYWLVWLLLSSLQGGGLRWGVRETPPFMQYIRGAKVSQHLLQHCKPFLSDNYFRNICLLTLVYAKLSKSVVYANFSTPNEPSIYIMKLKLPFFCLV